METTLNNAVNHVQISLMSPIQWRLIQNGYCQFAFIRIHDIQNFREY